MAEGLNEQEARRRIYMVDKDGLLLKDNLSLTDFQSPFARPAKQLGFSPKNKELDALIAEIKPTVLIGYPVCRACLQNRPSSKCMRIVKSRSSFHYPTLHQRQKQYQQICYLGPKVTRLWPQVARSLL